MDLQFSADATVLGTTQITGTVYVLIVDDKGVIEPNADVSGNGTHYSATLVTNPKLSVGNHKGSIDIKACADQHCRTVYGSASLSYDFTVSASTNLKTLSLLPGVSDWQPLNGNSQRTAYVPVTLHASAFSSRWLYAEPATQDVLMQSDTGAEGNLISNTTNTVTTDSANDLVVFADGPWLIALKETTGAKVWSENVDPHSYGNPASPAIANGVIYTTQGTFNTLHGAELATYDEATGAAGFQTAYAPTYCDCDPAPVTVVGTQAFLLPGNGGIGGLSVMAFDATVGGVLWVSPTSVNTDLSFALDSQNVYYVDDSFDGLSALDQPTGTIQYSVAGLGNKLVSLDGAGGAIAYTNAGKLGHVDLTTQTVDWTTPTLPSDAVIMSSAIGNGVLYTATTTANAFNTPTTVVAYSTSDGHELWSWSPPDDDGTTVPLSLIATKNLLFVSTYEQTYAIDVDTQAVVWTFPVGGGLSLSPLGVLYIQGIDHIAAINLH
jgi:hypothetical protein